MNKQELLRALEKSKETFMGEGQIIKLLCGLTTDKNQIKQMLSELVENGDLVLTDRFKYAITNRSGYIKGTFCGNSKGFGFVDYDGSSDDIFIPERSVNGAVHGDTVLTRIVPQFNKSRNKFYKNNNSNTRSKEGEIVKVLKRRITEIVGVFMLSTGGGIVLPDDKRFSEQVFIPLDKLNGAKTNQKVVVKLTAYPSRNQMATGEITEVLGNINDLGVDTLSIIRSYGLTEKFPEAVINEANLVGHEPNEDDKKGRTDFTNDMVITIDGEDARDFDDAISLTKDKSGYALNVHIADVSHYCLADSEIDKEAYKRGTSVYFPDMVLPMLPENLCNNVCSLNPNVERLTLSVQMWFDQYGNIKDYKIVNGVIKSHYRMTYTKVTKMFEGDQALLKEYADLVPMLNNMKELAELLIKRRDRAGELDFNLPEVQIDMDEQNKIKEIRRKPRAMSDRLIEQFMVITNEVVARHMKNLEMPFVYRVHEVPTPERLHHFNDFIKGVGLNLSIPEIEPKPKDVQKVLVAVKNKPMETIISSILLRSMQKARYYEKPLGDFGLALADYCHFTSPIRRYPDLTIHRIIKNSLNGKMSRRDFDYFTDFVVNASVQSSDRERLADEAERTVDDLKKAEYMTRFIGKEFDGMVSGASDNGVFVQLENTVEGFIRVEDLPSDKYYYDETKFACIGKKNCYRLGDKLKIKVFGTDLIMRKVYFVLADAQSNNS